MVRPSPAPESSIHALMAYYLRFLRIQRGVTQADVGKIIGCTKSQVSKYEAGIKHLDERQCAALDSSWDTGRLFTILLGYAKLGTDATWPTRLGRYLRTAVEHYIFASTLVPVPLQTESYARGVLESGHAAGFLDDVEAALKQRMELQSAILDCRPEIWVVIDEVALRPMGPPPVMAAQRERLLEMGALSHVSIRMLPMTAAPNIGVDGSFNAFLLPGRRLAAFSGSALGVGRVIDDQVEAASVMLRFNRLAARAWSEDQTRDHIAEMSEDHERLA